MLFGWEASDEEEDIGGLVDLNFDKIWKSDPTTNTEESNRAVLNTAYQGSTSSSRGKQEGPLQGWIKKATSIVNNNDSPLRKQIVRRMVDHHQARLNIYSKKVAEWKQDIERFQAKLPLEEEETSNAGPSGARKSVRSKVPTDKAKELIESSKSKAEAGPSVPTRGSALYDDGRGDESAVNDARGVPEEKTRVIDADKARIVADSIVPAQVEINYLVTMYSHFKGVVKDMEDWQTGADNKGLRRLARPQDIDTIVTNTWVKEAGEKALAALEKLNEKEGGDDVKRVVAERLDQWYAGDDNIEQERSLLFLGDSGVGKTTFASLISDVFHAFMLVHYEGKPLPIKAGYSLVGAYQGQTTPTVHNFVVNATERVVVLDEIYSLNQGDYGKEAVNALVFDMDNLKGFHMLVGTGYEEQIGELNDLNQGFSRRWQQAITFAKYTAEQLRDIVVKKLTGFYLKDYEVKFESDEVRQARLDAGKHKSELPMELLLSFLNACLEDKSDRGRAEKTLADMVALQGSSMDWIAKAIYHTVLEVSVAQKNPLQPRQQVIINCPIVIQALIARARVFQTKLRVLALEIESKGLIEVIDSQNNQQHKFVQELRKAKDFFQDEIRYLLKKRVSSETAEHQRPESLSDPPRDSEEEELPRTRSRKKSA